MPAALKNKTLEHVVRRTNKAGVAEFFGIQVQYVDSWIRQGCPIVQRGRRGVSWEFDLLDLARWHFAHDDTERDKEIAASNPEGLDPSTRLLWYKGERERIKISEQKKQLVPVAQYKRELTFVLFRIVNMLNDLPDVLEQEGIIASNNVDRTAAALDIVRNNLMMQLKSVETEALLEKQIELEASVVDG